MNSQGFLKVIPLNISMVESRSEQDSLGDLDSQSVSAIYNQYYPEVFRYARYRLGDETLAEDIASDTFLRLLKAVKAHRGPERNLRGWLIGTARHLIIDHVRGKYRHPHIKLTDTHVDDEQAPVEAVEERDASSELSLAMGRLTDEQQHVLALRFGQGYSLEETAKVMKKNVNAVKALQFRALTNLQRQVGGEK
jgi:RNA polymerase sigma-70 factor (ECF subfamily)